MENSVPEENNPWSNLTTVTTFDKGGDAWTTRRLDENAEARTGGRVVGRVSPSTSLLIESLIQQLCTMFEGDTARRNKLYYAICDRLHEMKLIDGSYNLTEFEMMRGQYQRALYHLVAVARASTGSESALHVPSCLTTELSRYHREFREISFIAAGGFGHVFKALHRLDGIEYAVKKIIVRSGRVKTIMQHLEEVKTIARLNHTNIVSYKGAWIEPTLPSTFVPIASASRESSGRRSSRKTAAAGKSARLRAGKDAQLRGESNESNSGACCAFVESGESEKKVRAAGMYLRDSDGSHGVVSERFDRLNSTADVVGRRIVGPDNAEMPDESRSDVVSFRDEAGDGARNSSDACDRDDFSDGSESWEESVSENRVCRYDSSVSNQYATLYIQMALCEKTLREWLDERRETLPQPTISKILTQILSGLDYIHSCNIVHHDIKPSNIFVSTSGQLQIQLGDFGLACPLQRENHRSVIGTHLYAAPEQLRGMCNPKSDVYSLGIVLLELLVPMQTCMERSRTIGALKAGQIPTVLATNHPKWADMINQLIQKDPNRRPSTRELLAGLNEDKDSAIAKLRSDNDEKTNTIQELQFRVAQLEAELARLKMPLGDT